MIFERLDVKDVIALGLTNAYFWSIAKGYLTLFQKSFLGSWAGTNLICVGDYTDDQDYPAGVLSQADLEELAEGLSSEEKPTNLYSVAFERYAELSSDPDIPRRAFSIPKLFIK